MAAEKSGLHQDVPVVCTVPSCPEKGATKASMETHIRVLGLVLGVAIIVAGFVGIVYILSTSESRGETHMSGSYDSVERKKDDDAVVKFDMGGKSHEEQVSVKNGGQLVTIDDTDDGFTVILDYSDGIAVVKNTSSLECYFLPVDKFPDYNTDDMGSLTPVIVQNKTQANDENMRDVKPVASFVKSDIIPSEFMKTISDPSIAHQCGDSTSYWLTEAREKSVQKRQLYICICVDIYYWYGWIIYDYYYCYC